jgi:hypothetical protein
MTPTDKSPREFWIRRQSLEQDLFIAIDAHKSGFTENGFEQIKAIEIDAYLAVKQELKNAKSALRCGQCGNVGMFHHGLQMQDTIDKLQQELDAARARERFHIQTQSDLIDRASKFAQQLADALAQIKDYESALEFYFNERSIEPFLREVKGRMGISMGFYQKAKDVLNKWRAK